MKEYLEPKLIEQLKNLNDLSRANMLILIVFKNKQDLAGEIYIRHLNKVAESFREDNERIVALLHDLVEDTSFTFEDLEKLGFSSEIIETLKLLTNDFENYDQYINNLIASDNILAKKIKLADLLDNMNLNRFSRLKKENFDKVKNVYLIAYCRIIDDLERRIIS